MSNVKTATPHKNSPIGAARPIEGVISPNLTPFNADLSIAEDLYVAHAKALLANGCAGLAPFGTTGEATSVGIEERKRLLARLIKAGISPDKLLLGAGLPSAPDSADLIKHALDLGCTRVMVLPPFYYKGVSDQGIFDYYDYLIRTVNDERLRLYLYHIPQMAQVGYSLDLVGRLIKAFPGIIVGIKDSSGDWENTSFLLNSFKGFHVYPGSELPMLKALRLGAPGIITATANINARALGDVYLQRNAAHAEALQDSVNALRKLVQSHAPIPAMKALLALASGDKRWANVRPPLVAMEAKAATELAARLKAELGFDLAAN
jgi:4-hydroxy-tetrahydrodipicolinate synthase